MLWQAISKPRASAVSSGVPKTSKQWKHSAYGLVLSSVSRCLEPLMKPSHLLLIYYFYTLNLNSKTRFHRQICRCTCNLVSTSHRRRLTLLPRCCQKVVAIFKIFCFNFITLIVLVMYLLQCLILTATKTAATLLSEPYDDASCAKPFSSDIVQPCWVHLFPSLFTTLTGPSRNATVSVKIVGTLRCLLAKPDVVHTIWWVDCDKQHWEDEQTSQKLKNSVWWKFPNHFCPRV